MDTSQVMGITLGGLLVSALGAGAEYMREKELPSYKGVVRDFLIGAVLVIFLLQIMPDSMANLITYLPSMKSLTSSVPSVKDLTGDSGPDLQIGPARF